MARPTFVSRRGQSRAASDLIESVQGITTPAGKSTLTAPIAGARARWVTGQKRSASGLRQSLVDSSSSRWMQVTGTPAEWPGRGYGVGVIITTASLETGLLATHTPIRFRVRARFSSNEGA